VAPELIFIILVGSPTEVNQAEELSPGLDCQLILLTPGTGTAGSFKDLQNRSRCIPSLQGYLLGLDWRTAV